MCTSTAVVAVALELIVFVRHDEQTLVAPRLTPERLEEVHAVVLESQRVVVQVELTQPRRGREREDVFEYVEQVVLEQQDFEAQHLGRDERAREARELVPRQVDAHEVLEREQVGRHGRELLSAERCIHFLLMQSMARDRDVSASRHLALAP